MTTTATDLPAATIASPSTMVNVWPFSRYEARRIRRGLALVWQSAPRTAWATVALTVLQAALPIVGLYLFKLIVDAVVAGASGAGDTREAFAGLVGLILVAALVAVVGVAASAIAAYAGESLSVNVTDFMLAKLGEKSAEVDFAYYEDPQYYNSLHRAQEEAPFRPTQLLFNLTQTGQSAVTAIGILALLASVHLLLALGIVVAVLPALTVRMAHARRLHAWQVEWAATERQASYMGWLVGSAEHAKEIRVFGLSDVLRARFSGLRTRLRESRLALAKVRGTADAAAQIGASLVVFGSFAFIGYLALQGTLTLGDFAMYFGAVQRGQASMQSLFLSLGRLYEDHLFLSNVDEFFELAPQLRSPEQPRAIPRPLREGIVCEGVRFAYPGATAPAIDGVDLHVRPGELVALVGANGSGKTTLVKLLCRLYDPAAGRICLDGIDIKDFDPRELRRQISIVFQDFARYHTSARENIWFGDVALPPTSDRVRDAARVSGADAPISRLRHGYDTILGRLFPEGEELSAGEWQKVALARAFLRDGQILIVDEPTSALDPAAEADVFRSLGELAANRATIVVSHRLSTIRMASRIYCLAGGRIAESGTHDELMARNGVFARLFGPQGHAARHVAAEAE